MPVKILACLLSTMALSLFAPAATTNHYEVLRNASWFAVSGGFANATTPEGHSLAALCQGTNNVATLERLLREKAEAQQLYGLLGLRLIGAPGFEAAAGRLRQSKAAVTTLDGCIVGKRPVAEVVRQIQEGRWAINPAPTAPTK